MQMASPHVSQLLTLDYQIGAFRVHICAHAMFMQERNGRCEIIQQEMQGSDHFYSEYNMFLLLHSTATS